MICWPTAKATATVNKKEDDLYQLHQSPYHPTVLVLIHSFVVVVVVAAAAPDTASGRHVARRQYDDVSR